MQNSKWRKICCFVCFAIMLTLSFHAVSEKPSRVRSDSNENDTNWWAIRHHDSHNSGFSSSTAPNSNNIIWNHEFAGSLHHPLLVWNNIVYVNRYGSRAPLYCLNATDGSVQWIHTQSNTWNAGQTPAIAEGYLYISFLYYTMENDSQEFVCLNATNGCKLWNYTFTNPLIISCASSPTVANGYVYFGSNNNSLFCFDANPFDDSIDEGLDDHDGAKYDLIWVFDTGGDIQHTPAVYYDKVYVVSRRCAGGDLYCLHASTGKEIWHKYGGDVTTSPVISNGRIYYGAIGGSTDSSLYASRIVCIDVDNPSTRHWEYGIETFVVYATPAIAYGKVFAGDDNGHMYCFDADDGTLIWDTQTDCKWMGSAPAVADNKLYTISGQQVVCLDCATGDVLWTQKIKRVDVPYKYVSPCIADDTVFVGVVEKSSAKSCIYAFADGIGIQQIRSGRPGPKVIVQNTGDIDLNVNVLIKFEHVAGFIFAWPEIPLSIGPLKAGTTYTHKRRVCGLGNIRIIASVNSAQTGYGSSKTAQAFVLGRNTIVLPDVN